MLILLGEFVLKKSNNLVWFNNALDDNPASIWIVLHTKWGEGAENPESKSFILLARRKKISDQPGFFKAF